MSKRMDESAATDSADKGANPIEGFTEPGGDKKDAAEIVRPDGDERSEAK